MLTEEETFNLGFATPYKSMSTELSVYCQGVNAGANAQLAKVLPILEGRKQKDIEQAKVEERKAIAALLANNIQEIVFESPYYQVGKTLHPLLAYRYINAFKRGLWPDSKEFQALCDKSAEDFNRGLSLSSEQPEE